MCGIFGQIATNDLNFSTSIDKHSILSALNSRGPDAHGDYLDKNIYLAHTRLSIIDLNLRSNQPMSNRRWVISYNGEIYNFKTLRSSLIEQGVKFTTSSDTEVLLSAISNWGPLKTLETLAGMFVFLAWDKEENKLWIARDRLGIKPLYFSKFKDRLAFASWPSALLNGLSQDGEKLEWHLDRSGLVEFFSFGSTYSERTLVSEIKSFPKGELWSVDTNLKTTRYEYWQPNVLPKEFDLEEFKELFEEVVNDHLISDVELGVLISGGVDSTLLASYLQSANAVHLESDEQMYAMQAAAHLGLNFINCSVDETLDQYQIIKNIALKSGAVSGSLVIPSMTMARFKENGLSVGLSANGADELFLGYPRTPISPLVMGTVSKSLPSFERLLDVDFQSQVNNIFTNLANFGFDATCEHVHHFENYVESSLNFGKMHFGEENAFRWFELDTYVAQDLNFTLDLSSMAESVEMRVPFLDHRLVEYALSLDSASLITGDVGRKAPLKKLLMERNIPNEIWFRQKQGFSINNSKSIKSRNEKLSFLTDLIDDGYLKYVPTGPYMYRNFARTLNAAFAFSAWKAEWIDTGIVRS